MINGDNSERTSLFILLGVLAGILLAGYFIRHTFSAFLTALAFAYLLNPVLKYLEERGWARLTALVVLYAVAAVAGFVASVLLLPYLFHQIETLVQALPRYVQNFSVELEGWKQRILPYYAGEEGVWLLERVERSVATVTRGVSETGIRQIKGLFFGLFDLVLAPILVFLILYYKEFFKILIKRMMPHKERHRLTLLGKKINRSLERFVLGMLADCLVVGLLTAAALHWLGVEFALLNGLFAGFASIVPFIGVVVALIPAAFIGYAKSGDIAIVPQLCIAYFIIHVIFEGNLIKPLVMRRTLKLNPLAAIFSVMAMGELLGFWGVVLGIPLAAVIKICASEFKDMIAAPVVQPRGAFPAIESSPSDG